VITMARKLKIISIILSVLFVIGFVGCAEKPKKAVPQVSQETTTQVASGTIAQGNAATTVAEEDIPIELRNLSQTEFGRDNPFSPLLVSQTFKKPWDTEMKPPAPVPAVIPKTVQKIPEPTKILPDVRLTTVIDEKTAIIVENNISKVVSVGDTVAGMQIVEIKDNKAVLGNDSKKFSVPLGGRIEEISSSVPKSPPSISPISPKAKTKKK